MKPSLPLVDVTGNLAEMLETLGVETSDLYRALANNPELLELWIAFAWGLRQRSTTPRALRELMILLSARFHRAGYQWADHVPMALAAGVSLDQVEQVTAWESSPVFDDATRAALALTEEMLNAAVTNETLESLSDHFDPPQRVELILMAGFYCMVPRVLDALRLEPEEDE